MMITYTRRAIFAMIAHVARKASRTCGDSVAIISDFIGQFGGLVSLAASAHDGMLLLGGREFNIVAVEFRRHIMTGVSSSPLAVASTVAHAISALWRQDDGCSMPIDAAR